MLTLNHEIALAGSQFVDELRTLKETYGNAQGPWHTVRTRHAGGGLITRHKSATCAIRERSELQEEFGPGYCEIVPDVAIPFLRKAKNPEVTDPAEPCLR